MYFSTSIGTSHGNTFVTVSAVEPGFGPIAQLKTMIKLGYLEAGSRGRRVALQSRHCQLSLKSVIRAEKQLASRIAAVVDDFRDSLHNSGENLPSGEGWTARRLFAVNKRLFTRKTTQ